MKTNPTEAQQHPGKLAAQVSCSKNIGEEIDRKLNTIKTIPKL
jgi:hypothetical protein